VILKWRGANAGTTEDSLTIEKWGNAFDIFTLTSMTTMSALLCMNMAANAGSISSAAFGSTADGKAVSVYTLTNDRGASVKFLSYGGIITQINVPDRWGRIGNVVLGLNTAAEYEAKSPYFGALVGRYANRIAAGKFSLDGNTYTLATNNGANSLHGGKKGLDKVIWNVKPLQGASAALEPECCEFE